MYVIHRTYTTSFTAYPTQSGFRRRLGPNGNDVSQKSSYQKVFFFWQGLVLLWYSAKFLSPNKEARMFYVAAVMIALGKSGTAPPLSAFFADQFIEKENPNIEEQEKIDSRAKVWWRIAWFSGASIAFFCLPYEKTTWEKIFLVSALVMGANLLLFLFGFTFYYRKTPERSPVGNIVRVFKAAIYRRHLNYPRTEGGFHWKNHTPSRFYKNRIGQTCLLPKVPFLG